jgi:hypothetical protein
MFTEIDLQAFTGEGTKIQHSLCGKVCYSVGAKFIMDNGAAWLIDKIATLLQFDEGLKAKMEADEGLRYMSFWTLYPAADHSAILECVADTGMDPAYREVIDYTDLTFNVKLFVEFTEWCNPRGEDVEGWMIYLPSEY